MPNKKNPKAKKQKTVKVEEYIELLGKARDLQKELGKLQESIRNKEHNLPFLKLDSIKLLVCIDSELDDEEKVQLHPEEVVGLKADCTFISTEEIYKKVYPFLFEHFPLKKETPKKQKK